MKVRLVSSLKVAVALFGLAVAVLLAIRIYDSQRGLPLEPWHTYVPHEMSEDELNSANWTQYLEAEARISADVKREVSQKLGPDERVPANRYFEESPVYPAHFAQDFNRSFVLEPEGRPIGVAVLLHGLTDSPYSQRHIASFYRDHGFVAIVPRLPAHGTVPAALTDVRWEDWVAATRLAVREARRRVPTGPLHLVGFSNGGALALIYALDALGDEKLAKPDRLVLISPMVGITRFARFAGLAGLPALLPAFAKAAWLGIVPEFNPFKYNSFPVNGARQSHRLTQTLQSRIADYSRDGKIERLPPILTFQSLIDFTVSTRAIVSSLYDHLPANGSELVLFDVNRTAKFGPLLRASADTALARIVPRGPRRYRLTVITNDDSGGDDVIERVTEPNSSVEKSRALGLVYPRGFYSLSHVALPFPMSDSLYGSEPDGSENFGENLGALAPRGERNVLIASLDTLMRASSNPFFSYLIERVGEGIPANSTKAGQGVQ
ncbi:alpha/beta hydrolase [Bradyrhizobium sp. 41S5]|uniref:alpha/beta hydrolase n=1 Tax=Bradyrhizobium sp. 41S5 TaxID=1404443 RepID=UPI00156B26AA|nr:alpha/beta hydrolase [Bradyrhizobium sp. 41S5]UFX48260.1 alpha/beta hydrolase [Bradyrhizobium sp. 41S5]